MNETIVISLGGSLIIPDSIDIDFLKIFRDLIISHVKDGNKFVIITGGGKLCRRYQDAAKEITKPSTEDLDWIGIASLKLNAELLRVIFGDYAHSEVISNLSKYFISDKPIIIGSAYKPGASSDVDGVWAARTVGAKKVINLSNIDYAYTKDPNKHADAKKIEKISWMEYEKLIPKEWNPGLSTPFDPVASRLAKKEGMEVLILNGKNIPNLEKCLNGESFVGTHIS